MDNCYRCVSLLTTRTTRSSTSSITVLVADGDQNHYAIHVLGKEEVSHIIHLRGIEERKLLYAYVELFNLQNLLIRLNMDHGGPDIDETYACEM